MVINYSSTYPLYYLVTFDCQNQHYTITPISIPMILITKCKTHKISESRSVQRLEGMKIQLKVDFDRQVLSGICQLGVRTITGATELVLDVLGLVR